MKKEMFLQSEFAKWLDSKNYLWCASAGGMRVNIRTAINMKRCGYKKGNFDLFLYEPRNGWHGLALELKVGTKPSSDQLLWQQELTKRKYMAIIMPAYLTDFNLALDWLKSVVGKYMKGE